MVSSIKFKLSLLLLASVVLVLLSTGSILSHFLVDLHTSHARQDIQEASLSLRNELNIRQADLLNQVRTLAVRDNVVFALNTISQDQGLVPGQTDLLDQEKKILAAELKNHLRVVDGFAGALYTSTGELTAFTIRSTPHFRKGIIPFNQKRALTTLSNGDDTETWVSSPRPVLFDNGLGRKLPNQGHVQFQTIGNSLFLEAAIPIFRSQASTPATTVGYLQLFHILDSHFLQEVSDKIGMGCHLFINEPPKGMGALENLAFSETFRQSINLFAKVHHDSDGRFDTDAFFLDPHQIDLADNSTAFLVLGQDKSFLKSTIRRTMAILLVVLLLSASVVTLLGTYVANRMISEPVARLVAAVQAFKARRYDERPDIKSNDELGLLARSFHDMAQAIDKRENDLIKSEARLAESQAIAHIGNWEYKPAASQLWWSTETYTIFGFNPKEVELSIELFLESIHPEDKKTLLQEITQGAPHRTDYRIIRPSGEIRVLHEEVRMTMDEEGIPELIWGTVQDVTNQKYLEDQLQQARKMEAIGTLAGGIAHDFNNILTPIMGYSDLVREELDEDSPVRANMDQIVMAAKRAKNLVHQILAFSRQGTRQAEPIQIHLIIKEVMKLVRSSLPSTIEIEQDINSNCGYILADPTQIHQVIMNLCSNAYYAMRETGGILSVRLSQEDITPQDALAHLKLKPGSYIHLLVQDTGHGIPAAIMNKIFEPYFTTKEEGEGSGMGLATIHGIIQSHNGHITVQSPPGQGAAFHIYLPVLKDYENTPSELPGTPVIGGTEHILLVDDEDVIVDLQTQLLENLGYKVTAMQDSRATLRLFEKQPDSFDLILTDMTMPHLTGAELAEKVLAIKPDLPIILCTGFSGLIDEEKAKEIGIKAFIMKPIIKKEIAVTLRELLDKGRS